MEAGLGKSQPLGHNLYCFLIAVHKNGVTPIPDSRFTKTATTSEEV